MPLATVPVQSLMHLRVNLDEDDREAEGLLSLLCQSLKMLIETSLRLDRPARLGRGRHGRKPLPGSTHNS